MGLFPRAITEYLAALEIPRGPNSNIFLVDPANGNDSNPGDRWTAPLKTLTAAEDKCVANQNDVVLLLADNSGITLTEKLTWDKSYTHLVGMCAPVRTAQRARIFAASTMDDAELIEISGTGCIFKNLYIFNGPDEATALGCVKVSGGRCYFENVHFAGGGHASNAIDGCYSLGLSGGDGEHLFKHCTIGLTTIAAATGVRALALCGGFTPRVVFEDCIFQLNASNAGAMMVEADDGGWGIDYHLYRNCLFLNTGATAIDTAFEIDTVSVTTQYIILLNCWRNAGIDDWEDQAKACVWVGGSPDQGDGTSQGDMVVASVA